MMAKHDDAKDGYPGPDKRESDVPKPSPNEGFKVNPNPRQTGYGADKKE